jgi:transcriptional regulator with XRE-family HTH domain
MAGYQTEPVLLDWTARREARGISLRQIADTTKIGVRYLEAIERGAFDRLPGGAYTEGYIRQYARAVGDTGNVLWDYYRLSIAREEPPAPEPETASWRLGDIVRSWLRGVGEFCESIRRFVRLAEPRQKATGD